MCLEESPNIPPPLAESRVAGNARRPPKADRGASRDARGESQRAPTWSSITET